MTSLRCWLSAFLFSYFPPFFWCFCCCCCSIWRQKARMPKTKRSWVDISLSLELSLEFYSVWFVIKHSWGKNRFSVLVSSWALYMGSLCFASPDSKIPGARVIAKHIHMDSCVSAAHRFNNLPRMTHDGSSQYFLSTTSQNPDYICHCQLNSPLGCLETSQMLHVQNGALFCLSCAHLQADPLR